MSDPWPRACRSCARVQAWPRPVCDRCGGRAFASCPEPLAGVVYSVTEVYRAPSPDFAPAVPYAVVLVQAACGGMVMGRARGFATIPGIGTPVLVVPAAPGLEIIPAP